MDVTARLAPRARLKDMTMHDTISPALKLFGSALKDARNARQWTLSTLAQEALGNPDRKGYVSEVEKGKRQISAGTILNFKRALDLPDRITDPLLGKTLPPEDETEAEDATVANLLAEAETLRTQLKLSEALAISLAYDYAEGNPTDFDGAIRGLRRAFEVAADEKAKGALPSNLEDAVTQIVSRVDALNDQGDTDAAAAYLAEEQKRATASLTRLYDKGIAQAILTRNVEMAVENELKKLPLDSPDPAVQFDTLRAVQDIWYERGRDKGLNFDLEVAIALARTCLTRATSPDERGTAGNDLGTALMVRGEREPGTDRLEEAVTAYRNALKEWTKDRVPFDWALAQNNLGAALQTLGKREPGTERLEEAVNAYRDALKEWTKDRVPLDWAAAQNNLGNALQTLGEREPGTERLEEAVTAYRNALKERTKDRVPLDWAMTRNNLGNALSALGEREPGTERLEQAVTAYRNALEEWTKDRVPLLWAMTKNNLGNALRILGEREPGTERLEEATTAYRDAFKERTRDRVPLDWAGTTMGWANTETQIADRTEDLARAQAALLKAQEAAEVLVQGGHEVWAGYAQRDVAKIQTIITRLSDPADK